MRARYNFPAPSRGSAEDAGRSSTVACHRCTVESGGSPPFVSSTSHCTVPASHPKGKPHRGGTRRGFRNIGRPGIGGAGGRPSPLVARHRDQVQSSKLRYSQPRLTAKARTAGRAAVQEWARSKDLAPTIQELQAAGCESLRAILRAWRSGAFLRRGAASGPRFRPLPKFSAQKFFNRRRKIWE